jgi:hypothetical protein
MYTKVERRSMKEAGYRCDLFQDRVGYKGQKYEVRFTEDGVEKVFGWQNEPSGGLADAAALHPGWTKVRVVLVGPFRREELANAQEVAEKILPSIY